MASCSRVILSLFPVVFSEFKTNIDVETYVIVGNDALLKCEIPSFVADLVRVTSWLDNDGNTFQTGAESFGKLDSVTRTLELRAAGICTLFMSHIVMNLAFLYCRFESLSVVTQDYKTYVNQAHVIRGNDVLFKCDIPSYVTDFVSVQSWQDNDGVTYAAHKQGTYIIKRANRVDLAN